MSFSLSFSEGDNIGGLRSVSLAYKTWLSSVNPVAFLSGKGWENVEFVPEQAQCTDSSKDSPNGTEYTYALWFLFNKQNKAQYELFKKYIGQIGIVKYVDNNGLTRIIGSPEYPVTINHNAETGRQPTDLNFYRVNVSWVSAVEAVVL